MTAFDNIKTNNWPATSNDLEDFLVLELPLNDQAALTSSRRDIVAGSKVLFPKSTLTSTGVSSQESGTVYSSLISGTVDGTYPLSNLFGGTIGTGYTNGTRSTNPGTLTLTLTSLNITVTNVRLSTYIHGTPATFTVNGSTVPRGSGNGDKEYVVAVNGQLNTIAWSYDSSNGPYLYMRGIEVDYGDGNGYQLLTDSAGGQKKHYANNAVFSGTGSSVTVPANPAFNLSGDFTIETWMYQDAAVTNGTIIGSTGYYTSGKNGNWIIRRSSGTQIAFATYDGQSNSEYSEFSCTTSVNTWNHLALTRSNNTVTMYLDGVSQGTMTVSKGLEDGSISGLTIGNGVVNDHWNGKFQDVRIYNGVAKYTANFTPPGAILG